MLRWLRDEEEHQKEQKLPKIEFLIVDLSPVNDIDTSGIHAFKELLRTLEKRQIQVKRKT
jgi:high affinity sulfate transporter 1